MNLNQTVYFLGVLSNFLLGFSGNAEELASPLVLGKGESRFEVGQILFQDDFKNLDNWVVQIEEKDLPSEPKVEAKGNTLDCFLPDRGCTVWFKELLKTRLAITYDVICPSPEEGVKGIMVKDVNNFWLASDRRDTRKGLFNSERYTGSFSSYDRMSGYYASSGGGRNTTVRMRRYPRKRRGEFYSHIALKDKDRNEGFLLRPDKLMKVQLVAFDDLVQYIVDGKIVYEMSFGDEVVVEKMEDDQRVDETKKYRSDRFPYYREGFFGFRMVGTHHIYSNFKVHELTRKKREPAELKKVEVSSLEELRAVAAESDQMVTMKPGIYVHEVVKGEGTALVFSGSRNVFNLEGVTFEMPISVLTKMTEHTNRRGPRSYLISGDEVILRGARFINTYPEPLVEDFDFGDYNQDSSNFPAKTTIEMLVRGCDCRLENCEMIVRGSFPYGYGNMFGIGAGNVVPLRKHSGILLHGDRSVMDGCRVQMEAFGHGIFAQYGDEILVKNCRVFGGVRPSNDFLTETGEGSLGAKFDHRIQWPESVKGVAVPPEHMINLTEDGIRAYEGTGKMTVENCHVERMRGGIKLYMAREAVIRNCEVLDCVVQGYSIPNRGVIENCRGNAAYGPLFYVHLDSHHSQKVDIEVLPAPHGIGDHPLAAIRGHNHHIRFTSKGGEGAQTERPIIIGYPMRFDYLSLNFPDVPVGMEDHLKKYGPKKYRAQDITLNNDTLYPVVLGEWAQENKLFSMGPVNDLGSKNRQVEWKN